MVPNPETDNVSNKFHLVFDDEFYIVPFMREGTIPPNWIDIVQCSSQSSAMDNIDLKDTWFTPDIKEDTIETPRHKLRVVPENNNNTLMLPQYEPHVQESLVIKGASAS